jgi:hypothetical protein
MQTKQISMRNLIFALCFVLGSVPMVTAADLEVIVTKQQAISGAEDARKVGSVILIPTTSTISAEEVATLKVETKARYVFVDAEDASEEFIDVPKIGDNEYLLKGTGKFKVTVNAFDEQHGFSRRRLRIELGRIEPPKPPEPPPTPTPEVPSDAFDNIGQRVANWAKGLPSNKQMAAAYRKCQPLLTESNQTINEITVFLLAELDKVPSIDRYAEVRANINADLRQRTGMPRGVLADYYSALAAGFEGAK